MDANKNLPVLYILQKLSVKGRIWVYIKLLQYYNIHAEDVFPFIEKGLVERKVILDKEYYRLLKDVGCQ